MRVLVAGGAGFIGARFVAQLAAAHQPRPTTPTAITVLDLRASAEATGRLGGVAGRPDVALVTGDVCDGALLAEVVPGHDAIVNFAAETHVDRSISGPASFVRTNVVGAGALLDAARSAGVARFVQVSTDEVYGPIERGAAGEDAPLLPTSPYAATKAAADLLALAAFRTYGLDVRITRGCNTYGPWQEPEKVVPLFVTELLDCRPVPVYGDGRHVREWLHVDDHCAAIRLVLEAGQPGGVYNVGSGERLANIDLARHLTVATDAGDERIEWVADRPGHDVRYAIDCAKIAGLGFTPRVRLGAGMLETVRWYADNRPWWERRKRELGPHR